MHISIRLRNALVLAFLMVSMLMPKVAVGQVWLLNKELTLPPASGFAFNRPSGILVHSNGLVYVSDGSLDRPESNRIFVFNRDGTLRNVFGDFGFSIGKLCVPQFLEEGPNGSLVVSNAESHKVQLYTPEGAFLYEFGGLGSGDGELNHPRGVMFFDDKLFVVDSGNNRIQVFSVAGGYLFTAPRDIWGWVDNAQMVIGQLVEPFDISMRSGSAAISLKDGRVLNFNQYTGRIDTNTYEYGGNVLGNGLIHVSNCYSIFGPNMFGGWDRMHIDALSHQPWWAFGGPDIIEGFDLCLDWPYVILTDIGAGKVYQYRLNDYTAPHTEFYGFDPNVWYREDLRCEARSGDNLSGVRNIYVNINRGTPNQKLFDNPYPVWITDNGENVVEYWAVDWLDNVEIKHVATVKIDKIAPVTNLSRNAGLITLAATDAHSGVAKIKYQINGGAVTEYSAPLADTIHKVTYWAEDVATNVEAAKTDIINAGVQRVTVSQNRIPGGIGVIGTVTLDKAAPVGGTVVTLTSSLPSVAFVDPTVTVPEGATTATFDIDANPVAVDTTVSISASIYETNQSALVTVQAPTPSSIAWSVSPVIGGTSTTGTISISGPAPAGGTTVSLASTSLSALVGSSVSIPTGAMTATFNVSTNAVSNDTSAVISATVYGAKLKSTLSILGPKVSSVTLATASVVSLGTTTGTVTLSSNAPTGGKVVNLSSSNAAVASVPVSVTVAAGTKTATFTVTAGTVATNTNATITVAANGSTGTATVTVTPPVAAISSLTTNVAAATGGLLVTGTVTLTAAAPTGGAVVTLASSSTTVGTVPASVTVPAGATSSTFTITTKTVTAATTLTVTGTYLGVSKTASVTVNPVRLASTLTLNPASVKGGVNSTGTVTLTGVATEAVVVTLTSGTTTVATVPASVTVPAGASSVTITITTRTQTATRTSVITARTGTTSKTATLTVTP